jgi:hypothetical protein
VGTLDCKTLAAALDVAPTKTTQAWRPALDKVARMMVLRPAETASDLAEAMTAIAEELRQERFEQELPERTRRATGGRRVGD